MSAGRLKRVGGRLMVEPEVPPGMLCGGYEAPWYPSLTDDELTWIANDPDARPDEQEAARDELGRRAAGVSR